MSRSALSLLLLAGLSSLAAACRTDGKGGDTGLTATTDPDADGDGFTVGDGDCDDGDAAVNPGATELCNGVDDDCDGDVDEEAADAGTWYADADGDGYGDPAAAQTACEQPSGAVADGTDCDDADADSFPGAPERCDGLDNDCDGDVDEEVTTTWYADADGDGHGDAASPLDSCDPPSGYVDDATDCDDADAGVHPGATELCNGVDDDCDGDVDEEAADASTFYADADGDGYGDEATTDTGCEAPSGYVAVGAGDPFDCDDGDAAVNPGATELCNGVDDDCDGTVDEDDAADASTWNIDYDGDGYGSDSYTLTACEQPSGYVADDTDCDDTSADAHPGGTEVCDGLDNDCDGTVDEDDAADASTWYADADGDGYGDASATMAACDEPSGYTSDDTDCDDTDATVHPGATESWFDGVDSDCDGVEDPDICVEGAAPATTVSYDASCTYTPVSSGSWSIDVGWSTDDFSYSAGSSYTHVMMTPAVGRLQDTTGDGVVDADDLPVIAYTTFYSNAYSSSGYLRVIWGDGSGEVFSVRSVTSGGSTYYPAGSGGVAIADLEGDGSPELLVTAYGGHVLCLDNSGALLWVSDEATASVYTYPSVADLDGDGTAEVIAGDHVFDATGATLFTVSGTSTRISEAADIDGDGTLEVVNAGGAYEPDGSTLWASSVNEWAGTAIGDLDGDDAGEVVANYGGTVSAIDDDGSILWSTAVSGGGYGPPCMADFDGDGEMEVAAAGKSVLAVLDTDGSTLWTTTIHDYSSSGTSCSSFDFDGDGASELFYADETTFRIYDGASGTVLYSNSSHASGTLWENPFVVDVDNDGNAEVVVPSNNYAYSGWDGIHVLEEVNDEWQSAGTVYNQHAFAPSMIEDDMTVPTAPTMPWIDDLVFRGQSSWAEPGAAPDLAVEILDACEDCSAGTVELYVAVQNQGAVFAPAGTSVALYAVDGSTTTLLDTTTTTDRCEPGDQLASILFSVDVADVGADGLMVVVDDDGTGAGEQNECDETNNSATWDALTCASR